MNEHPKRFVLGLDRVFAGSWFTYKQKISLWRKALADLDKTTAKVTISLTFDPNVQNRLSSFLKEKGVVEK